MFDRGLVEERGVRGSLGDFLDGSTGTRASRAATESRATHSERGDVGSPEASRQATRYDHGEHEKSPEGLAVGRWSGLRWQIHPRHGGRKLMQASPVGMQPAMQAFVNLQRGERPVTTSGGDRPVIGKAHATTEACDTCGLDSLRPHLANHGQQMSANDGEEPLDDPGEPRRPRWAVSGRTHGEVLTAGVSTSGLEIVLLGVPQGFTPAEVEGWLHDLSGGRWRLPGRTPRAPDSRGAPPRADRTALLTGRTLGTCVREPMLGGVRGRPRGTRVRLGGRGLRHRARRRHSHRAPLVLVRDENGNEAHATTFARGTARRRDAGLLAAR